MVIGTGLWCIVGSESWSWIEEQVMGLGSIEYLELVILMGEYYLLTTRLTG